MLYTIIVPVNQDYNILNLFTDSLLRTVSPSTQIIFINDGSGSAVFQHLEKLKQEVREGVTIEILQHDFPLGCAVSINSSCGERREIIFSSWIPTPFCSRIGSP